MAAFAGAATLTGTSSFRYFNILNGYSVMHSYAWLVSQGTVPVPVTHKGIAAMSAHGILSSTGRRNDNEAAFVGTGTLYPIGTVVKPTSRQTRRVTTGRSGVRGLVVSGSVR